MNIIPYSLAMELAVRVAGHDFPQLSKLVQSGHAETLIHRVEANTSEFGIFIMDITLTPEGQIRLIEANGSNAALTSVVCGKDDARARHMFLSYMCKPRLSPQVVALLAYQRGFLHIPEYFMRAGIFTAWIAADGTDVYLRSAAEDLEQEAVSVVCGSIEELVDHIQRDGNGLRFRGRPVSFACNPNVLAELVRRGIIQSENGRYDIDTGFFHDGPCTALVHDKGTQQAVASGTGILPLRYEPACSFDECLSVIAHFHDLGMVAVGKMNAGSGGTGIEMFPPFLSREDTETRLQCLIESAQKKYGQNIDKSIYPIRFFEFARSTNYILRGKPHLWDLRVQCLIYPGYVEVTPCIVRLCPAPFNEKTFNRDGVVSNLTGRKPSLQFMRSPLAKRRSQPCSVFESVGVDEPVLRRILESCVRWCESAWEYSSVKDHSTGRIS